MGIDNVLWYIEDMMKDPHAIVKIHLPNERIADGSGFTAASLYEKATGKKMPEQNDVIKCFLTDAVELSTSASYTTLSEALAPLGGAFESLAETAGNIPGIGGAVSKGLSTLIKALKFAKSAYDAGKGAVGAGDMVAGTIRAWTGSEHTIPPIPLTFVAIRPDDNILQKITQLTSMCMPGTVMGSEQQGDYSPVFWAPNKYNPAKVAMHIFQEDGSEGSMNGFGYGNTIDGTCRLEIGQWFSVGGLIPVSTSFSVSHLTTKKGYPLYATGTVTFETYRSLRAKEYLNFFRKTDVI